MLFSWYHFQGNRQKIVEAESYWRIAEYLTISPNPFQRDFFAIPRRIFVHFLCWQQDLFLLSPMYLFLFLFLHSHSRFKRKQIAKIFMCKQIGRCLRDQNSGFLPQETLRESFMWTLQFGYSHFGRLKNSMKKYVLVNSSRVFSIFHQNFFLETIHKITMPSLTC